MQRNHLLHKFDVLHQSNQVVREELDSGNCSYSSRIEGRGMDMSSLHQTELLAGVPAHLESLEIQLTSERIERPHDVTDRAITMIMRMRSLGFVCLL